MERIGCRKRLHRGAASEAEKASTSIKALYIRNHYKLQKKKERSFLYDSS